MARLGRSNPHSLSRPRAGRSSPGLPRPSLLLSRRIRRWRQASYSNSELIRGSASDARAFASMSACSHCLRVRSLR